MSMDEPSSNLESPGAQEANTVRLVVRRTINATAERLFEAWTRPDQLAAWWGPSGVECVGAEVDLRVGGAYRIGNRFASGRVVWIAGEFELVEAPHMLVYTWSLEPADELVERVTVRFEPLGDATEVVIVHERIADIATRDEHEAGWVGCLDGLVEYVSAG